MPHSDLRPKWPEIKAAYLAGQGTCRELSERFGVPASTISQKCFREGWRKRSNEIVASAVQTSIEMSLRDKIQEWTNDSLRRSKLFKRKIERSLSHEHPDDKLPSVLDSLTKAEQRVDDIGRRALGLPDPRHVDITSGGLPLGMFESGMDEIRKMISQNHSTDIRQINVENLASVEISDQKLVENGNPNEQTIIESVESVEK